MAPLSGCAAGGSVAGRGDPEEEVVPHWGAGGGEQGSGGLAGAGTAPAASCDDGTQNGGEDGIDCGGSCQPCCQPMTYEKTTDLASGVVSVCCDEGDTLDSVLDCGVGDNHGAKAEGACGVGFEGAMNGGSACVNITCETGCGPGAPTSSSSSSASSSASGGGSGGGPGSCAHDKCEPGDVLAPSCDSCVESICAEDPYCCDPADGAWDALCIGMVDSVCGETC